MEQLTPELVGKTVLVRARLHGVRETGKVLFITLRQGTATAQAVALKGDNKDLFKWATCAFGGLRAGMGGAATESCRADMRWACPRHALTLQRCCGVWQ